MKTPILLLSLLGASLFLSGCVDDDYYYGRRVYRTGPYVERDYYRPGYVSGPDYGVDYAPGEVDFYYVSGRPYSHSYGPLFFRGGRYYYSQGGNSYVYDRERVGRRRVVHSVETERVYRDADHPRYHDEYYGR